MSDDRDDLIFRRAAERLRAPGPRDRDSLADVIVAVRRDAAETREAGDLTPRGHATARYRRRARAGRGTARFIFGLAAGIAFTAGLGVGIWAGWRMRGESYRIALEDAALRSRVGIGPSGLGAPPAPAREPVQFMLVAPSASRVALVGEFNDWDAGATPMWRAAGGTWHVALPLAEGRHVYAFVVDGTSWVADPQAPLAPERWFGASNSVLLVNGGAQ